MNSDIISGQYGWLRYHAKVCKDRETVRLNAAADTMESMLAVVKAALWLNEVNGTPERNMELIQTAFAKLNEKLAALNDDIILKRLKKQ